MIIVTGGAGMIGSNIVKALNNKGCRDILVVDNLKDGTKIANLVDLDIADYVDKENFITSIVSKKNLGSIEAIFHQGACASTTEWDGKYMMHNNYQYSKDILNYCIDRKIPFLYASSGSVYGSSKTFIEKRQYEEPLNVYSYSKFLFDQYVRKILPSAKSPICGFRYFNVYGPREGHKGAMSSIVLNLNNQIKYSENIKIFAGSEDFKRDFIHVEDVAAVNIWFYEHSKSGIFNCGTGKAESFQLVADVVINFHKKGRVKAITFPKNLKGRYQEYTQADLTNFRSSGYDAPFKTVLQGVKEYLTWLNRTV